MSRTRSSRRAREKKLNRWLMAAFALLLFAGLVLQIAMMSRLSGQNKRIAETEKEIAELGCMEENLDRTLSAYHDLNKISAKAKKLGMQLPDSTQLRVVNLPGVSDDTSAQSADNSGAEGKLD